MNEIVLAARAGSDRDLADPVCRASSAKFALSLLHAKPVVVVSIVVFVAASDSNKLAKYY